MKQFYLIIKIFINHQLCVTNHELCKAKNKDSQVSMGPKILTRDSWVVNIVTNNVTNTDTSEYWHFRKVAERADLNRLTVTLTRIKIMTSTFAKTFIFPEMNLKFFVCSIFVNSWCYINTLYWIRYIDLRTVNLKRFRIWILNFWNSNFRKFLQRQDFEPRSTLIFTKIIKLIQTTITSDLGVFKQNNF